jgi:hypothetical protein
MIRFVIIAQPRTGSSMLVNSLNSLDFLDVYGEVFAKEMSKGHPQKAQDEMIKRIRKIFFLNSGKSVQQYLDDFYSNHNGFKLLYPHVKRDREIYRYIENNDIKKILLFRENKFKQVLSAMTNGREGKVKCYPKAIEKKIIIKMEEEQWLKDNFCTENFMTITYEQLTNDTNAQVLDLGKIFKFLDIQSNPLVKVPMTKYRPSKVSGNICNINDMKEYFKDSDILKWID